MASIISDYRLKLMASVILLLCAAMPCQAVVYFNDGGTHTIDYQINEPVEIYDHETAGLTTVNVTTGASLGSCYLWIHDTSVVNMDDGTVATLNVDDHATLNFSGDENSGCINAKSNSTINFIGGHSGSLSAGGSSAFFATGGNASILTAQDTGYASFTSGTIYLVRSVGLSRVLISGDAITNELQAHDFGILTMIGGTFLSSGAISLFWGGTVILTGNDFEIDGMPAAYGEYNCTDLWSGSLTGVFTGGDSFACTLFMHEDALIGQLLLVPDFGLHNGDVDLDNDVDLDDLSTLAANWKTPPLVGMKWTDGDMDLDDDVDLDDLSVLAANWGYDVGSAADVPEMSTGALLVIGLFLWSCSKRAL